MAHLRSSTAEAAEKLTAIRNSSIFWSKEWEKEKEEKEKKTK